MVSPLHIQKYDSFRKSGVLAETIFLKSDFQVMAKNSSLLRND